jgi:predicted RNA methylase
VSSTGRSDARSVIDYYRTPAFCTRAILSEIPDAGTIIDAGAGDGAISRALVASGIDGKRIVAVELDAALANECRVDAEYDVLCTNWLTYPAPLRSIPNVACVIMNPPY